MLQIRHLSRVWALFLLVAIFSSCVASDVPPLPTQAQLPTITLTHTRPAMTMPVMLPTPPGETAVPLVPPSDLPSSFPSLTATLPVPTLSRRLVDAPLANLAPVVVAAVPTREPIPPTDVFAVMATPAIQPSLTITPTLSGTLTPMVSVPTLASFPTVIAAAPTFSQPESAAIELNSMAMTLYGVPLFYNFDTQQVRDIATRGREMGNQPQVFTTVGDSNSVSGDFLRPIVIPDYCTWGDYEYLRDAVAYYSVPPDRVAQTSFTHDSIAVQMGFNSASARDPFWATASVCEGGESPMTCELRSLRPSVVIILLGGKDVSRMSVESYRENMTALVEESISRGVIPVLTTFVVLPGRDVFDESLTFNLTLMEIAQSHGTPLVNLWSAASALPDFGIAADATHLKTQPGRYCDFAGGETLYGGTLRNLMTLQALDLLRVGVLQTR